jgi:hypothetical protein
MTALHWGVVSTLVPRRAEATRAEGRQRTRAPARSVRRESQGGGIYWCERLCVA